MIGVFWAALCLNVFIYCCYTSVNGNEWSGNTVGLSAGMLEDYTVGVFWAALCLNVFIYVLFVSKYAGRLPES